MLTINNYTQEEYIKFLRCKELPYYNVIANEVHYNDIYDDFIHNNKTINKYQLNEIFGENSSYLFDYQKFIIDISLSRKKYACFGDAGLGKTAIFIELAKKISRSNPDKKVLIISPLMIIHQTLDEEYKFYNEKTIKNLYGNDLKYWLENGTEKIGIINYEYFINNPIQLSNYLSCLILDESSILKSESGKIKEILINISKGIEYKFCFTATPAPNDREEYANHALFLEQIRTSREFFHKYFVNKDKGWVLKKHAEKAFYRHLANYSIFIRHPKDYGFDYDFKLPNIKYINIDVPLTNEQTKYINVKSTMTLSGSQVDEVLDLNMRNQFSQISKGFILSQNKEIQTNKYKYIEDIINKHPDEQIIIWTVYNKESEMLKKYLSKYNIKEIQGSMDKEERYEIINNFKNNKVRILISKPKLLGFGMNFQNCHIQIFSGLSDSYESLYQAIKRCNRFGSVEDLLVYFPLTQPEKIILNNVMNKKDRIELDALRQEKLWIKWLENEIENFNPKIKIKNKEIELCEPIINSEFAIYNNDNIIQLENMKEESIDFSIFSPPFASLFVYSNDIADMGNSGDGHDEFSLHYLFFMKQLFKVMKKGRMTCIHLSQLSKKLNKDGVIGIRDFRGTVIKLCEMAGFIFKGEWVIAKNPQMQAIKEKVRTLSFSQLDSNRLGSAPGLNDMILIMKKPGESETKVISKEVTRDEWIEWACGVWKDIPESNTLNVHGTKGDDDVKHICPLNLDVIERCIRMYTNPGETVLSPFMGIGSEGVMSLNLWRKFIGIELKKEYFEISNINLDSILKVRKLITFNENDESNYSKDDIRKIRKLKKIPKCQNTFGDK